MAIVLTISSLPSSYSAHRAPPISFQTRMIHRSSPESPLYNPNVTPANLSRTAAIAAKTRRTYIARHKAGQSADGGDWAHAHAYTSPMTPFGLYQGEYIIRYSIGSDPPTETYGVPDTGSDLIWLQCLPCHRCYTQNIKYFDPAKSSSYSLISCNDELCTTNPHEHCEPPDRYCHYNLTYADESMTSGNLATETITFGDETSPSHMAQLYDMVIGCGHYNIDNREGNKSAIGPPGVVGLSWSSSSLLGQLAFNRFSYCASANQDPNAGHSLLKIGIPGALITGKETQTPLYSAPSGSYLVNVTDLMVDEERLNIPPALFRMGPKGRPGTIIDTGTTFSEFVPGAFNALVEYINAVQALQLQFPIKDSDFDLCFADISFAPKVTIMFENLNFELSKENTWEQIEPRKYCLAILRGDRINIIGMSQQKNVNVGYDLKNKVVSFKDMACPLMK
ncbi:aspartic proteinase CDR1-like [Punica granatum]|nr:aspartic proteinase CDR1-like [Punica granatum]